MKKLFLVLSAFTIVVGVLMVAGGVYGILFTRSNVAREKVVTPDDASIPKTLVSGPLTLKAQADIIRTHALRIAGGKAYAEMPREIPKLDSSGNPILDEAVKPVMTANTARDIWITATTLITALNLGIMAYVFSSLILLLGLILIGTGMTLVYVLKREV